MSLKLDEDQYIVCEDDPENPWVNLSELQPELGQLATFLCENGMLRIGYGRGRDSDPAVFYQPDDRPQYFEDNWPVRPIFWKRGISPQKVR